MVMAESKLECGKEEMMRRGGERNEKKKTLNNQQSKRVERGRFGSIEVSRKEGRPLATTTLSLAPDEGVCCRLSFNIIFFITFSFSTFPINQ